MGTIQLILDIISGISSVIGNILKFKWVYKITGFLLTRKFKTAKQNHKYAILVAARNEETVIGKLIESIKLQDYPQELITVFVVADNCTDKTAATARELGAVCYERFDNLHRTKGFALQYLVECIRKDYGIDSFEAYFIFDADNLMARNYITEMNKSFDAGEKIVTSYRNTKNFGDNWISASYGIHWLRTVRNEHRPRSLFRLATRIQGTGFMFAHELIKDGWNYTSLTEDRAFCADAVVNGYTISYNNNAVFYDEQPTDFKTAMRQRIRWAKGHLQAFGESGPKLFWHIFVTGKGAKKYNDENTPLFKRILYNLRFRFMSFDMLTTIYPRALFIFFKRVIVFLLKCVLLYLSCKKFGAYFSLLGTTLWYAYKSVFENMIVAAYVYFVEFKRIEKIPILKKLWFCITFPLFDIMGKFASVIALFTKVEWKPIKHKAARGIDDIDKKQKPNTQ